MNALLSAFGGMQPIVDAPAWVVLLLKLTAILAAAWFVHAAIARVNPRWRVVLWRVTAVGLLATPAVAWLLPSLEIRVPQAPVVERPTVVAASPKAPVTNPPAAVAAPIDWLANMPETTAANPMPASPSKPLETTTATHPPLPVLPQAEIPAAAPALPEPSPITGPVLLLTVWLGGIVVLGLRLCLGHYQISAITRRAIRAPHWVCTECSRVAEAIGCRRSVEVMQSTEVESPFLCGLGRPMLLLPARMCEASYRKDLPGILAHELAHVRSHDIYWNIGLQVISILLWLHPLTWRMRKAHLAACELVSDAVSASFVGDVTDYCRTLARVAVDVYASLPSAGIAMARTSAIGRRLGVLRKKVFHLPLRRRSILGFGFSAFLAVSVIGAIQFALAAPPEAEPTAKTEKLEAEMKPAQPSKIADATVQPRSIRVKILDQHGKPLQGVNVHSSVWTEEKGYKANQDHKTNSQGQAVVDLPNTFDILRLFVTKGSYVPLFRGWGEEWLTAGNRLPDEHTFTMKKGTVIGGTVKNEDGKPIAGVKVEVNCDGADCLSSLANGSDARVTDAQGRWTLDNVPEGDAIRLSLRLNHPNYASDQHWGDLQNGQNVTLAAFRAKTATIVMPRGIAVTGAVTDADGKPVADAVVAWGDSPYGEHSGIPHEVRTDAKGVYLIPTLPPGPMTLTVMAEGSAPDLKKITVTRENPKVDFQLKRGKTIRFQFVDTAGKPISGVRVQIQRWRGGESLYNIKHPNVLDNKIPWNADKNGVWEWTWAPDDPVELYIDAYPLKYAPLELEIAGGAPPRTITLKPEHRVTGRVTDAVTGKPIPAFTVIPLNVFRKEWLSAERNKAAAGKDGRFEYLATRADNPLRLRIEAIGYRNQDGAQFHVGVDDVRPQDFRLQPSKPIVGVVLDSKGQPATNARVFMATPTEQMSLEGDFNNHEVATDASGRFEFPDPGERFAIVATTDAGFATADFAADQRNAGTLHLQPWATIRGRFFDGGKPVKNATLFVNLVRLDSLDQPRVDDNHLQLRTDANGRFVFTRVPPVPVNVRVYLGPWEDEGFRSGPSVPLYLKPGQQVELDLGNTGATIKGQVKLTGKVPPDLNCTYSLNHLISRSPVIEPPPAIAKMFDISKGWQRSWLASQEGHTYLNTLQHWFVKLAPDGSFRVSGVPPGEYDLAIEIYAKPSGCLVEPLTQKVIPVTVTADDAARGEMTLPDIAAKVIPIPAVGDTPSVSFQRPDGSNGSLADFHGRNTVVHFWASWCGPCKQQLPAFRNLQERFAARGFATLGLSLDIETPVWQAAMKQLDLPWQQGRLNAPSDAGVSSVPAFWLLDATGKIVAKSYDLDELAAALKKAEPKPADQANAKPKNGSMHFSAVNKDGKPIPGASIRLEKGSMSVTADSIILDGASRVELKGAHSITLLPENAASLQAVDEHGKTIPGNNLAPVKKLPDRLRAIDGNGAAVKVNNAGDVVEVYLGDQASDDLLAELRTLPQLRSLHVEVSKHITDVGLAHIGAISSLKSLNLCALGVTDDQLKHLAKLTNLRELSLAANRITDAGLARIVVLKNLTKLNISGNSVTDAGLVHLAQLTQLQTLSLHYQHDATPPMHITDKGLAELRTLKELRRLDLFGAEVTSAGLQSLTSFPHLESLSLSGFDIADKGMIHVAACRNLRSLDLLDTRVRDAGLVSLADLKQLRRLSLNSDVVTDAGIATLKTLPRLEHLELRARNLTDNALAHIAEIKTITRLDLDGSGQSDFQPGELFTHVGLAKLKGMPNLRTLWLNNLKVTPSSIVVLGETRQLKELVFMMSDITEEQVNRLRQSLPKTRVSAATGSGYVGGMPPTDTEKFEPKPAEKKAEPNQDANSTPKTASLQVRVVDEDGKPLPDTNLDVKFLGHEKNYRTDADGRVAVVVPGPNRLFLSLIAYPAGYPPMRKWWKNDSGNELIPDEFTFTFAHGHTIGGQVRDEQGKPIQGVKVHLSISSDKLEKSQMCLALWNSIFVTDNKGEWSLGHVPLKIDSVSVGLEHPDYISKPGPAELTAKEQQQIEDRTSVMVMKKGVIVTGTVTDPEAKPVAGATIYLGEWYSPPRIKTTTDQQGRYRFANLAPSGTVLTVVKPGLAPALRNINAQPSMKPVDFQLEKGNSLRVRVVDKDGKPLAGIFVTPDTWRGRRVLCDLPIRGQTDAQGRWAWTWAPKDAVKTDFGLTGYVNYMSISGRPLAAQEAEHVITMYPALTISGRVVDAATKQPIPHFRVICGNGQNGEKVPYWDRSEAIEGKDGQYKTMFTHAVMSDYKDYFVRIEADGYQPAVSRAFKDNEGNVSYDFAMKKGKSLMVAVRLADGKPAAGAEVGIFPETPGKFYNMATFIKNGRFAYRDSSALSVKTDPNGVVLIPPQDNGFLLVIVHDQGFAKTTSEELIKEANDSLSESEFPVAHITLQAWARLEGAVRVMRVRSKPMPNVKLDVYPLNGRDGERWGFLTFQEQTEADADGKFVFPKLKPGKWNVRELPLDKTTHRAASEKEVDLAPGQTVRVSLGESQIPATGSTVIGQIKWPHGEPPVADLARINATVLPKMPAPASPPKEIVDQGPDAVRAWMKKWWQSDEAKAWEQTIQKMQQYRVDPKFILIRSSGSFRARNLLPGQYQLTVGGFAKTKETPLPWERPAFFVYEGVLSVPATADNTLNKPLDVGTLPVIDKTPKMPAAADVKPPAPLAPGQKTVGPLRDNLDLLRYIVVTNAQNRAKIQTWQGKAAVQSRSEFGSNSTGQDYSATVDFLFDRARKSTRWNTTLDKWAKIVRGIDHPEPVPQILNGMMTPQGIYRFGSDGSPGNPAKRPLTLTITSLGPWPMGQVQPDQFDFIPTFYYSRNETHGDLVEFLQSYLGSESTPYMAAVKVSREGDQVTIDMDSGRYTSFYTVSLSQGCNAIAHETAGPGYEQKYHWTYELRDGVWLPKTWSQTDRQQDDRNESRTVRFVESRINQPVEPAAFSIRSLGLKSGDNVRDERVDPVNQYPYDDSDDIRDLPDPKPPR
jgi:beta-lactamase regulating signal transducer with metallopeptidase domain/uncharacterized GH25 family protein/thiol-disulfide isomerase/thioredoxin/Leucine-rich repeat (LRR) protein